MDARARRRAFLRDLLALQAAGGVDLACQAASAVGLALLLGARGQGLFVAVVALQALLASLLNAGVLPGTVSQLAAATARGKEAKTADWLAFLAKGTLVHGTLLAGLGALALPALGRALYAEPRAGVWAAWVCCVPLAELPRTVATGALHGTRRLRTLAQLDNAHALLRLFLVLLGALLTGTAGGAAAGLLAASATSSALALGVWAGTRRDGRTPLPGVRELAVRARAVPLAPGLRLGLRIGVLRNLHTLACNVLPRLVLGEVAGLEWAAFYHVAERLLGVAGLPLRALSRAALPALGERAAVGDRRGFERLFRRLTLLGGSGMSLMVALVVALVRPVTRALFPDEYVEPVFRLTCILALGHAAQGFGVATEAFFVVANRIRAWYALSALGIVLLVPVNVLLVRRVEVTGAAWSVTVYLSWMLVLLGWSLVRVRRDARAGPPAL